MQLQLEFDFTLPHGYIDQYGQLHKQGRMRRAHAFDEIEPVGDPRVQQNALFLPILMLSRVVTGLGNLPAVTTDVVAGLFASDLAYLEEMYQLINHPEPVVVEAECPHCRNGLHVAFPSHA
ncbi:MAG: phage tail assembly protein [Candidatus Promineifilaceae bacterium]